MSKSIFLAGREQDIKAVLANRDDRLALQRKAFQQYPQATLLDVKLNIPGPIKNNRYLQKLFAAGISDLEERLQEKQFAYTTFATWHQETGCEQFYILKVDAAKVKQLAIAFEDAAEINRLFDADVLVQNQKQALSRLDNGLLPRKCFLCNRPAKECARSRRHSVAEMQEYISKIFAQTFC
ncbi:citrate lyase holo-[acyl-carrier protein] synthase [Lactobacillus xylocopicola]|nr:citrate lyase holo-[acyl-carrier protein] synthase [Lactobacillus xylocopicola]